MKHDFHFVLTKVLKNNITNFASENKMKLSEAVIYIFSLMKPLIEKHYLKDHICEAGEYSCFGSEVDMHVYFDKTDYRYLKQIQSNLYCFSMALVLRWVLNHFFSYVDKYGFDVFVEVIFKYGSICSDTFFNKNNKKQHMFSSIHNFQYIYHIFDKEYNLISTKFT